jgi:hypothetical protein
LYPKKHCGNSKSFLKLLAKHKYKGSSGNNNIEFIKIIIGKKITEGYNGENVASGHTGANMAIVINALISAPPKIFR